MADSNETKKSITQVRIPTRTLRPGNRYSHNVYDEYGNRILDAHTPITQTLINHLLSNDIEALYYDPASATRKKDNEGDVDTGKPVISENTHEEVVDHTRSLFDEIRTNLNISPAIAISKDHVYSTRSMIDSLLGEIDENEDGVFSAMTKLKTLDDFYYVHSTNVSVLGALLGTKLELQQDVRTAMGVGGLFHDIGMTSVSKDILHKLKKTQEEINKINLHPHVGYKLVEKHQYMHELEKRIILLHHEKADGRGFPYGFEMDHYRDQVPKEVRLMSLIDTYVSLVFTMPDSKPMSSQVALRSMLNLVYAPYKKVFRFLPEDFRDFIRGLGFTVNNGKFFLSRGDVVRLNTGEVALVEELSKLSPLNPRVRIVKNSQLQNLKRNISVDMLKDYGSYISNVFERKKSSETE